jgi:hypothetical protein
MVMPGSGARTQPKAPRSVWWGVRTTVSGLSAAGHSQITWSSNPANACIGMPWRTFRTDGSGFRRLLHAGKHGDMPDETGTGLAACPVDKQNHVQ